MRQYYPFIFALLISSIGFGQEKIYTLDFNGSGSYTVSSAENIGTTTDYWGVTNGGNINASFTSTTNSGNNFFGAQDFDGLTGLSSTETLTISGINISNYTGQISFTTAMHLPTGGDDFIQGRSSNVQYHLGLSLSRTNDTYNTDIYFATNATQGLDPGFDAGLFGNVAPEFSIYSHLVADNEGIPMAIQALGETDYNNITIPLGVNANQGEQLTFSVNDNTLPSTVSVYLEDTLENTLTLLNTSDYILTPTVDLSGTGRFFLNFSDSALSTPQNSSDALSIYANDREKTIVITGQLLESTTAKIYDIQGRLVTSKVLNSDLRTQSIDTNNMEAGVYIVELSNNKLKTTKKVILR